MEREEIHLITHPGSGVTVFGGERATAVLSLTRAVSDKHEYGTLALTLELVDSMDEAIDHIHRFGSGHTEAIITGACLR